MWNGAFSPVWTKADEPKPLSKNPQKPTKVDTPPHSIPDILDLEVWQGEGSIVGAWQYDGVTYLSVKFNHKNVCYQGEDAPSNSETYVYLYSEDELGDALDSEFGNFDF